jgi:hypothetical protein
MEEPPDPSVSRSGTLNVAQTFIDLRYYEIFTNSGFTAIIAFRFSKKIANGNSRPVSAQSTSTFEQMHAHKTTSIRAVSMPGVLFFLFSWIRSGQFHPQTFC